jgi:hypothetical protein
MVRIPFRVTTDTNALDAARWCIRPHLLRSLLPEFDAGDRRGCPHQRIAAAPAFHGPVT